MRYDRVVLCALALGLLLVSGCAERDLIYDDVWRDRTEAYGAWVTRSTMGAEGHRVINGDLPLGLAFEVALLHNKAIHEALEEQKRGSARLLQSISRVLPTLDAFATHQWLDEPSGGTVSAGGTTLSVGDDKSRSFGFTIRQTLFAGFGAVEGIREAGAFELMADQQVRTVVEQVMSVVALNYLEVLLAEKLRQVNVEALKSTETHLNDVKRRKEAGLATQFDVLRATVEMANAQAQALRQANAADVAMAKLLRTLGVAQQSRIALTTELTYEREDIDFDEAMRTALRDRPDLYMAELELRMQQHMLKRIKGQRLPTLSGFFTKLWTNPDPHDSTELDWGDRYYYGLTLSWGAFTGLRTTGEIMEQRANVRKRHIQLASVEDDVELELKRALLTLHSLEEVIETQRLNVQQAEEGLSLALRGYPDLITLVEVTDARSALVRAQGLYWQAVHDHCAARVDLQGALGRLAPSPRERDDLTPTVVPLAATFPGPEPQAE